MVDNETSLPLMNISQMAATLSNAYIQIIKNGKPVKDFPSVMLWGPPGVGKSQGIREIADRIKSGTGKNVVITDVRLLLFNPVDLRGIPTANQDKTAAVWLRPQIFQMSDSSDVINILLLDEISAAPQSVQAAAYQITLDRAIGEHRLPDNCIVIAAGNRVTDKSVAYNMPRALANRLLHIEIKGDADSWHDWAVSHNIHRYIASYIEFNPTALLRSDIADINLAYPTPRSWEMASGILNNVSEDMSEAGDLISGCIGANVTHTFKKWCRLYQNLPDVKDIFEGRSAETGNEIEILIALRSEMLYFARNHPEKELIENSIRFACSLPWDFRVSLLHDYDLIPELHEIIADNEVYMTAKKAGLK